MRIGVVFPQTEIGADAGAVRAYAEHVEELGFTHLLAYDHVVGADPEGSIYSGDIPRSYAVEGIGMSYLPETVDLRVIDEMVRVSDRDSFLMARRIAREEGLLVGGSSGTAAVVAVRVAKTLPPEALMVVVFPDSGRGYMSKVFNDEWMIANGFIAEGKHKATVGDVSKLEA